MMFDRGGRRGSNIERNRGSFKSGGRINGSPRREGFNNRGGFRKDKDGPRRNSFDGNRGGNRGSSRGGNRGGDRGDFNRGNRGGFNEGNRGGFNRGNRGGFNEGNRGGFNEGNRGGFNEGNQGGFNGGDRRDFRGNQNDLMNENRGEGLLGSFPQMDEMFRSPPNPRNIPDMRRGGGGGMNRENDRRMNNDFAFDLDGKRARQDDYDPMFPTDDNLYRSGEMMMMQEELRRKRPARSVGPEREYCKVCSKWFNGSFQIHRRQALHMAKANQSKPRQIKPATAKPPPFTAKKEAPPVAAKKEAPPVAAKKEPLPPKKEEEIVKPEDIVIPKYNSSDVYGREFVIAVSGFFCRLCHKFYNSEAAAFETHCKSESHYDKVVNVLEEKKRTLTEKLQSSSTGTPEASFGVNKAAKYSPLSTTPSSNKK